MRVSSGRRSATSSASDRPAARRTPLLVDAASGCAGAGTTATSTAYGAETLPGCSARARSRPAWEKTSAGPARSSSWAGAGAMISTRRSGRTGAGVVVLVRMPPGSHAAAMAAMTLFPPFLPSDHMPVEAQFLGAQPQREPDQLGQVQHRHVEPLADILLDLTLKAVEHGVAEGTWREHGLRAVRLG